MILTDIVDINCNDPLAHLDVPFIDDEIIGAFNIQAIWIDCIFSIYFNEYEFD